jgi:CcmD family protein
MKKKIATLSLFIGTFLPFTQAQTTGSGEDFFQSIGKMYVVVAVLVIIFIGLVIYLARLDKKISNLEK